MQAIQPHLTKSELITRVLKPCLYYLYLEKLYLQDVTDGVVALFQLKLCPMKIGSLKISKACHIQMLFLFFVSK